jgi:hypothetical protein
VREQMRCILSVAVKTRLYMRFPSADHAAKCASSVLSVFHRNGSEMFERLFRSKLIKRRRNRADLQKQHTNTRLIISNSIFF